MGPKSCIIICTWLHVAKIKQSAEKKDGERKQWTNLHKWNSKFFSPVPDHHKLSKIDVHIWYKHELVQVVCNSFFKHIIYSQKVQIDLFQHDCAWCYHKQNCYQLSEGTFLFGPFCSSIRRLNSLFLRVPKQNKTKATKQK